MVFAWEWFKSLSYGIASLAARIYIYPLLSHLENQVGNFKSVSRAGYFGARVSLRQQPDCFVQLFLDPINQKVGLVQEDQVGNQSFMQHADPVVGVYLLGVCHVGLDGFFVFGKVQAPAKPLQVYQLQLLMDPGT